jgi:hypothetical protein
VIFGAHYAFKLGKLVTREASNKLVSTGFIETSLPFIGYRQRVHQRLTLGIYDGAGELDL